MHDALLDGWADALGHILAAERREWQREREFAIAEIRADAAQQILAMRDALDAKLTDIARQIAALPVPRDGRDADMQALHLALAEMVAAITLPQDGERGAEGPPGKLPVVRAWDDRVQYEGMVVTHAGSTWQARCDTAREPPHEDWILLAAAGSDGRDAPVGEVCGAWQPDRRYQKFDLVAADGGEWRARYDDPGQLPGDGWALSAVQGRRGKPGERGERGLPAEPAAVQTGWEITGYVLVPVMSDGSIGPPLDTRPLFELYDSERA